MRLLMILALLFLIPSAFADIIVVDQNGLTRAAKRGVDSANITVEFTDKSPDSIKLKSVDGSSKDLSATVNFDKAVIKAVPAGNWKVETSGANYKVQIK